MSDPNTLIPGPKILLMGDSGTGKSYSLRTLIDCGLTPFVIATEQNAIQAIKDLPKGSWHYRYIQPQPDSSFMQMRDMLGKINTLSFENLTKVVDPFKATHNKLLDIMSTCNNFVADDDGISYGDVGTWSTDRVLVIDGLSGLSDMAMGLVVGNKPVRSQADWGVSQNSLKMIINMLTTALKCSFVLIAHIDREKDEITGGTTITVKTLGQKLGPDLPRMFSDVIRAKRDANKFSWDTADAQATVVARHLPIASNLPASFVPVFDSWKKSGGSILPSPSSKSP